MEWKIVLMNMLYAGFGAILTMGAMIVGYKIFDKITPFDTAKELSGEEEYGGKGNIAVGIVVGSIFIGLGLAIGLVVGLGLV